MPSPEDETTPRTARSADWLGRGLSVVAIAASAFAWSAIPLRADPGFVLSQELVSPSVRKLCPLPPSADPTDIGDVMEVGFSPLMSRLSVAIFHDDGSNPVARNEAIIDNTAKLLGCIQLAAGDAPPGSPDLRDHYVEMLTDLRDSVALLQLTGVEDDPQSSAHWFDHTRKQCARCHMVYKPATAP